MVAACMAAFLAAFSSSVALGILSSIHDFVERMSVRIYQGPASVSLSF
jgi:hypothetical protein